MICVSVQERTTEATLAAMRAAGRDADLVEIRLDGLAAPDLPRLFRTRRQPTLATCRPAREGGRWDGSETARFALLRAAAHAGADFVDIELSAADAFGRPPRAKLVISHHDFAGMPRSLDALVRELWRHRPDVVKVSATPRGFADARALIELPARSRGPLVAVGMGPAGVPTRVLYGRCGGAWTYASAGAGRETAPGQVAARDLRRLYRSHRIGPATEIYGVVGDPVGHSLGPRVFNRWFARLGRDAVYVPFLCRDERDVAALLEWKGVRGLSVTIPHKELALGLAARASEEARAIGAANTLVRTRGGWRAYNTDEPALAASVAKLAQAARVPLAGLDALVLGAGGAARAAVHALKRLGCRVTVTGRTNARARALAREFGVASLAWSRVRRARPDLLVNATPVGMAPQSDALPAPAGILRRGLLVFDLIYNPSETRFLREARRRGAGGIGGLDMFVAQAALQAKLWTGGRPRGDAVERWVREALGG